MMVEKVPDSTYEMIGGLDKQIKEIKEVRNVTFIPRIEYFYYLDYGMLSLRTPEALNAPQLNLIVCEFIIIW